MTDILALLQRKPVKWTAIGVGAVLVLWAGASLALPLFVSSDTIRKELISRIEQATGRTARIDGGISFRTFPRVRLSAGGIGLSNRGSESETFSVESISVGVRLLALLRGRVEITRVVLDRPQIVIEQSELAGPGGQPAPQPPETAAATGEAAAEGAAAAVAALDRLRLGTVEITDGELIWRGADGVDDVFERINLTINVPTLAEGGEITGEFAWRGIGHQLSLTIGEAGDPVAMRQVPIGISLTSQPLALVASGVLFNQGVGFNGELSAKGNSLRTVAATFGTTLPDLPGYGAFDVSARLAANPTDLRVTDFNVALAGLVARGAAVIDLNRIRPGAGIRLAAEEIDLNQFTSSEQPPEVASSGAAAPGAAAEPASDEIDLSFLRLADATIDLTATRLRVGDIVADNIGADVSIVGGVMQAKLRSIAFGGAPGSGEVTVDASGTTPAIAGTMQARDIDLAALASLAGREPAFVGFGGLDVRFATQGRTSSDLIANLDAQGEVSIANGRYRGLGLSETFNDPAADVVSDINVTARFTAINQPVEATGSLTWRGELFNVSAVAAPKAILAGASSQASVSIESARVNFGYSGQLTGMTGGSGEISLSTASLRNLLAWVGRPVAAGGGLGAFAVRGTVAVDDQAVTFTAKEIQLDGSSGQGSGTVDLADDRPSVTAELALATLDLTPYFGSGGSPTQSDVRAVGGPAMAPQRSGWSQDSIGFDGLAAIDAELSLSAERILLDSIRTDRSALKVTIQNGELEAELSELSLYGGQGTGRLAIDGAAATPTVEAEFDLIELAALPFLTDAFGLTFVEGVGGLNIELTAAGTSQAALVANLNGDLGFAFRDGAIRGIDISKLMQSVARSILAGWQNSTGDRTDFTQLAGSFEIENGTATTSDLSMIGPLVRVTGGGTIDIPNQQLALRVDPKVVASLQGQGGSGDVTGFSVPVVIEGAWAQPRIYPEIEGILENPTAALEQLQSIGDGVIGLAGGGDGGGGGLLSRIFGGGSRSSAPAETAPPDDGVGGLIGSLVGAEPEPPALPEPPPPPPAAQAEAPAIVPPEASSDVPTPPVAEAVPPPPEAPAVSLEAPAVDPIAAAPVQTESTPAPAAATPNEPTPAEPTVEASLQQGATTGDKPVSRAVPLVRMQLGPDGRMIPAPDQSLMPPASPAPQAAEAVQPSNARKVQFIPMRMGPNGQMIPVDSATPPAADVAVASAPPAASETPPGAATPMLQGEAAAEGPLPPLPRPKPARQVAEPASAPPAPPPEPAAAAAPPPARPSEPNSTDAVLRDLFGR